MSRQQRIRRRTTVVLALLALTLPAAATGVGAAEASEDGTFEIPDERFADLEDAGYGYLFDDTAYPPQPDGVPWPTETWPYGAMPDGVDVAALQDVLAEAFAPGAGVEAAVVVQGGRLVLQRYRDGYDPARPHISWSMAKSITQAMLGVLVSDGHIDPFAPAPVPEWSDPADPRHEVTIDHLLYMRSGLEWTEEYAGTTDVTEMLFGSGADDRAAFAAAKPLESEPGTVWEYSTGTSMIVARVIADIVGYGDEFAAWAQDELFGPLGITTADLTLDTAGVPSGGSGINMTALDFARFGFLYLRGGSWDGEQIVPEVWVDYARMPMTDAPAYGAHWWVGGTDGPFADRFPTMFSAEGFNGQSITVIPELDAVIVVLSTDSTGLPGRTVEGLIEAFAGVAR